MFLHFYASGGVWSELRKKERKKLRGGEIMHANAVLVVFSVGVWLERTCACMATKME